MQLVKSLNSFKKTVLTLEVEKITIKPSGKYTIFLKISEKNLKLNLVLVVVFVQY